MKTCLTCRHCRVYASSPSLSDCTRKWLDPITGKPQNYGGDGTRPCWELRQSECGYAGLGWQAKPPESDPPTLVEREPTGTILAGIKP